MKNSPRDVLQVAMGMDYHIFHQSKVIFIKVF